MDLPCIKDLSLVNVELKDDFLKGKSLEILLLLLSSKKNAKEISKTLNLPVFSVQLYLKRLLDADLVKIDECVIIDGKIEKTYTLKTKDVDILNFVKNQVVNSEDELMISAEHFSHITKNVVLGLKGNSDKPHKMKAYFIKANSQDMKSFKRELDELFEKYQALEDLSATDTYGFLSVLAPYTIK